MKTAVVVTLIVVGAILIITPFVAHLFHNVVRFLGDKEGVSMFEAIGETFSLGCWFMGSAMIAVSVLLAIWFNRQAR